MNPDSKVINSLGNLLAAENSIDLARKALDASKAAYKVAVVEFAKATFGVSVGSVVKHPDGRRFVITKFGWCHQFRAYRPEVFGKVVKANGEVGTREFFVGADWTTVE